MKGNKTWLAWALSVGLIAYLLGAAVTGRSVIDAGQVVRAYASGTALHADALQLGLEGPRLADVEAAFSAANVDSLGFGDASRQTENQIFTQPTELTFAGENASARGSGIELGLGDSLPAEAGSVLSLNKAMAVAPPNAIDSQDAGPVPAGPLLYASLLHGDAIAQWEGLTCLTSANSPIAYGRGYAADVELLDAGAGSPDGSLEAPVVATDDPDPNRNAVTSWSFVYAIPNGSPGHYGLVSEVHQTYAPIEILQDPVAGGTIEIEVLGEWFLRTQADGVNPATMVWGVTDPATGLPVDPAATVIRVSAGGGEIVALSLNDLVGSPEGLEVPIDPVLNLMLAEDPRAISAPGAAADPASDPTLAANGTFASGAVDVVRLNVLDGPVDLGGSVADLRVGHFESELQVPAGGFTCTPPTTTSTTTTTTTSTTVPTTTTSTSTTTTSTTTTTTTAPTTTTTAAPTTTTTAAPTTTSSTAPTTTSTTAPPPPPAPAAIPIRVQPRTVG